ncbi:hypothetical protein Y1Q_0007170 [Alligator mississippiensis]|uniref:Uncharacterized protein n=1 Tax=Alligator mississippiensis TaxID=8496 RepID=A0A151N5V8_ALLMI|nr:hypothetical protein Y1Q_0007170 [Alligator mississippiensis]
MMPPRTKLLGTPIWSETGSTDKHREESEAGLTPAETAAAVHAWQPRRLREKKASCQHALTIKETAFH